MKNIIITKRQITSIIVVLMIISLVKSENTCKVNEDCRSYYSCIEDKCVHKDFFPITFMQIIEIIAVLLFSSVATACGVGGGAIYSTLLMLVENFDASKAFPISNFMILLSSLSVYLLGAQMHINVPEHKFVDYDLVLVFCPMLLLGTKVGVILNSLLPSLLLNISLVYVLYSSTSKIYKNYRKSKDKEDKEEEEKLRLEELEELKELENYNKHGELGYLNNNENLETNENKKDEVYTNTNISNINQSAFVVNPSSNKVVYGEEDLILKATPEVSRPSFAVKYKSNKVDEILKKLKKLDVLKIDLFEETQPIKWAKIRIMAELLFILIIDQFVEGSSKVKSVFNLKKCSMYWVISAFIFSALCLYITLKIIDYIKREKRLGDLFEKTLLKKISQGDESFSVAKSSDSQLRSVMLNAFIGGIIAGMLGIGGGMIITPLFLQLGVNPKVTTSTSNFLLVFTSCASTIQYVLAGQLVVDYGVILALLAMISSIIGYKIINDYIAATGKSSFLLYALFLVMLISLIVLPFAALKKIVYEINKGNSIIAFKNFCEN